MDKTLFQSKIGDNLLIDYRTTIKEASPRQLHNAVSRAAMSDIIPLWNESEKRHNSRRSAILAERFLFHRKGAHFHTLI